MLVPISTTSRGKRRYLPTPAQYLHLRAMHVIMAWGAFRAIANNNLKQESSLSLSISVLGIVAQQAREADRCLLRDYGGSSSVWAMESPRNIAVSLFYRGCYSVRGRARRSYVGRRNRACSTRERTVLLSCRGGGIVTFETVPVHLRCTTCPTQPVALMPKTPSLRQPRPPRAGRDASYTSTCMGTAAYIQKCSNVL